MNSPSSDLDRPSGLARHFAWPLIQSPTYECDSVSLSIVRFPCQLGGGGTSFSRGCWGLLSLDRDPSGGISHPSTCTSKWTEAHLLFARKCTWAALFSFPKGSILSAFQFPIPQKSHRNPLLGATQNLGPQLSTLNQQASAGFLFHTIPDFFFQSGKESSRGGYLFPHPSAAWGNLLNWPHE